MTGEVLLMIMDILVLILFALTIFFAMRRGFVMTVVSFLRGIATIVIAWFFCDDLAALLLDKTGFGTALASKIQGVLTETLTSSQAYEMLPALLRSGTDTAAAAAIADGTDRLTHLVLTILCFFLILIVLRLVLMLLIHAFSHEYRGGFVGGMDWLLGILMGVLLGALSVLLFLALLFPLVGIFLPSYCDTVAGWMDDSYFAEDLYNNNLLLILFRDFI